MSELLAGDLWVLVVYGAAMLATGAVGGILAGLLGVGGGIVVVPVLYQVLTLLQIAPDHRMHVAVATSLATIIPTSISSSRSHYRRSSVDMSLARRWALPLALGSVLGVVAANFVDGKKLVLVFAIVALIVAFRMVFGGPPPAEREGWTPRGPAWLGAAGLIGFFSALMGIGGGTLSVSTLTAFGYPIRRAVGTGALFGLFIAVPGAIGFMVSGWGRPALPPWSLGHVSLIGCALIVPTSMLAAPWGARLAHAIPPRALQYCFAGFLVLTSAKFFHTAFF